VPQGPSSQPDEAASDRALLAEQRAYYRLRAPEYDEWWQRTGRYDTGEDSAREWADQVEVVATALGRFGATGDVLELAGGTGWWTERLARSTGQLTVVDASPETLAINRHRVGDRPDISYVVADLFDWRPDRLYDAVFFSFWLSHVPRARFAAFWQQVGACLRPGGRVFLIDNRRDPTVTRPDPYVFEDADDIQRRRLGDGSEHRVVKVFYEPAELEEGLSVEAWRARIEGTRWFVFGSAERRES